MTPCSRTDWAMIDDLVARAGTGTPDYVDEVLAATARVHQRPAWTFPSRWAPRGLAEPHPLLRYGLVLALLGLALIGGLLAWAITRPPQLPRAWANGVIAYGVDIASYEAAKNGGALIFTIDPVNDDLTPPTDVPGRGPYAFSPDGTRFAFFVGADQGSKRRLYTSAADGSQLRFHHEIAGNARDLAWSPDGRWIAATVDSGVTERVVIFAADGSTMRTIEVGAGWTEAASWAPTSDRIVFLGACRNGDRRPIYTAAVEGATPPVLLAEVDADDSPLRSCDPAPAWSPDGEWIAYVRRTGAADDEPPGTAVHVVRPDGAGDHTLAIPAGWASGPAWSPDGRMLLVRHETCVDAATRFCRQWTDTQARLFVVPLDGSTARRVGPSSTAGALTRSAWSPDGRMIVTAVETGADGPWGAALIDVASNTWHVIGAEVEPRGPFSWQPIPAPDASQASAAVPTPASPTMALATPTSPLVISGTLTDTGGAPLAGVVVRTEGTDNLLAVTGADGVYRLELTAPGAYRLRVGPIPGRLDHPVYFGPDGWTMSPNLADGSTWEWAAPADVDLVLPDATRVSGTFVDADGAPYRNAQIDVSSADGAPASGNGTFLSVGITTDDQGRFSLLVLPGRWDLMVDGGDYRGIVDQITVGAEPITGLVITRAQQP